jgi:hypothetical protein
LLFNHALFLNSLDEFHLHFSDVNDEDADDDDEDPDDG